MTQNSNLKKLLDIRERQMTALLDLTKSGTFPEAYSKVEKFYIKKNRIPKEITTGILQIYIEENSKNFNRYRSYEKGLRGKPLSVKKCSWEEAVILFFKKNPDKIEILPYQEITPQTIQNLAKMSSKRSRSKNLGI